MPGPRPGWARAQLRHCLRAPSPHISYLHLYIEEHTCHIEQLVHMCVLCDSLRILEGSLLPVPLSFGRSSSFSLAQHPIEVFVNMVHPLPISCVFVSPTSAHMSPAHCRDRSVVKAQIEVLFCDNCGLLLCKPKI